jgi:uncharacterized protein (DUF58 family)
MQPDLPQTRETTIFAVPLVRIMVAPLLLTALLNGQTALALLSILILVIVTGAKIWSSIAMKAVSFHLALDRTRAFPGEPILLSISARNEKSLPLRLRLTMPESTNIIAASGGKPSTLESGLLWYETAFFEYRFTTLKRGIYPVGRLKGSISDLLGFFQREIKSDQEVELVVYPAIHPVNDINIPRRELFGIPGDKNPVHDPAYLLGTREYQPWQPARYIHWKASARRQILQEKLFQPSEQEKVLLAMGIGGLQNMTDEDTLEKELEASASLSVYLERKGCSVGLATDASVKGTGSAGVPVGRGGGQVARILEIMARIRPQKKGTLLEAIRSVLSTSRGVTCIHFTAQELEAEAQLYDFLRKRKIPILRVFCGKESSFSGDAGTRREIHLDDVIVPSRTWKEMDRP